MNSGPDNTETNSSGQIQALLENNTCGDHTEIELIAEINKLKEKLKTVYDSKKIMLVRIEEDNKKRLEEEEENRKRLEEEENRKRLEEEENRKRLEEEEEENRKRLEEEEENRKRLENEEKIKKLKTQELRLRIELEKAKNVRKNNATNVEIDREILNISGTTHTNTLTNTQLSCGRGQKEQREQINSKKRCYSESVELDNELNYIQTKNKIMRHENFKFDFKNLNKKCTFCSYYHKANNHELKYCSFICTNQKCLGKEVHPKMMCESDDSRNMKGIEYNATTFLIQKYMT